MNPIRNGNFNVWYKVAFWNVQTGNDRKRTLAVQKGKSKFKG